MNKTLTIKRTLWIIILLLSAVNVSANPKGANVISGQASLAHPSVNALTITNTPGAIINWQSFDINPNEITRFIQQNGASAVLNRVVGNGLTASQIMGTLASNGKVFLINPNGIVFGANSVVDTAGLIASSLNISDQDFLNNNLQFDGNASNGAIENKGYIKAGLNGEVFLIAPNIENSGIIETNGGHIILAAGEKVSLASFENENIVFQVQSPDNKVTNLGSIITNGGAAELFAGTITHSGSINADSVSVDSQGRVVLNASDDIFLNTDSVITASGDTAMDAGTITISAHNEDIDNNATVYLQGEIRADGQTGGDVIINSDSVLVDGTISVNGEQAAGEINIHSSKRALVMSSAKFTADSEHAQGGTITQQADELLFTSGTYSATGQAGGRVELLGDEVKLASANVDASGEQQGGDIRVGGGFKGEEVDLVNASHTQVNGTTILTANANDTGDGGSVVVWADGTTRYSGMTSATGGSNGGDGGSAEVSGKQGLSYNGVVDLSANFGLSGTLLLDPKDITITASGVAVTELLDPNPNAGDIFGTGIPSTLLSTGMLAVIEWRDDFAATDAGAFYLFNPNTGALISTLTGGTLNDFTNASLTTLSNGNFVLSNISWDNGGVANAGAATWGNGTTGVSGAISAANSLVGTTASDNIGLGVTALTNGNYVVSSKDWDNGGILAAGMATWVDGTTGQTLNASNVISNANSFVGTKASNQVSLDGVVALSNGNYVVDSPLWRNSDDTRIGAVTWGNGTTGSAGDVADTNSLVGIAGGGAGDVGTNKGVIALSNGHYVVVSPNWDSGTTDVGAVTWMDGTSSFGGLISLANSLSSNSAFMKVGDGGVTALTNGNYVVSSTRYGGTNQGAVTWIDGSSSFSGLVSNANSLFGTTAIDNVGVDGVVALTNGNYVVRSQWWDNGGTADVGAVTWGNGTTGTFGAVTTANSLFGSAASEQLGSEDIVVLTNGNYVVANSTRDNGANTDAGMATWVNGSTGLTSNGSNAISSANSLIGSTTNDSVGVPYLITTLTNGNYVVGSNVWDNGGIVNAGAATWVNGSTGLTANGSNIISSANSLVGTASDGVSSGGITALTNGNYVVASSLWQSAGQQAGAATWGDGTTGVVGTISAANSLVGSNTFTGDNVSGGGITALSDGNYVVSSTGWSTATLWGAVTWGDGASGTSGVVSSSNSQTETNSNHAFANGGVIDAGSGKYAIMSPNHDGNGVNAGQIIIIDPSASGSASNSVFGDTPGTNVSITEGAIEATLNTGTALILQANNDITVDNAITVVATGNGGDLSLIAGRSIIVNANIATDGGDFMAKANSSTADGVSDANRDAGAAEFRLQSGLTIDTNGGDVTIEVSDGAGLTNSTSGNLVLEELSFVEADGGAIDLKSRAGSVVLEGSGTSGATLRSLAGTGGDITITSDDLDVQAGSIINTSGTFSGNLTILPFSTNQDISIGTAGAGTPLEITAAELARMTSIDTLTIGRSTDTGTLTIAENLTSAGINASTLILKNQNIISNNAIDLSGGAESLQLVAGALIDINNAVDAGNVTLEAPIATFAPLTTANIDSFTINGTGSPTASFDGAGTTLFRSSTALNTVIQSAGTIDTSAGQTVTIGGTYAWTGGTIDGSVTANSVTTVTNTVTLNGLFNNNGAFTWSGGNINGTLSGGSGFNNNSGGTFNATGNGTFAQTFTNSGNLSKAIGTGTTTFSGDLTTSSGSVSVNSGTIEFDGYTQTGGITILNGGNLTDTSGDGFDFDGGTLKGIGTVTTNDLNINNGATLAPGASPGTLNVVGNLNLGSTSTTLIELGGTNQGVDYDFINVTGNVNLDGILDISMFGGFTGVTGNIFDVIQSGGVMNGSFATVNFPTGYSFNTGIFGGNLYQLGLLVVPVTPSPSSSSSSISISTESDLDSLQEQTTNEVLVLEENFDAWDLENIIFGDRETEEYDDQALVCS
jgi:trimeric autotransporter adhesin